MKKDSIEPVEDGIWHVTSSHGDRKYTVTIENEVCPENCKNDCNICMYSYLCMCPDNTAV